MNIQREQERFLDDWTIDFGKKLLYRKSRNFWRVIRDFLVKPKYPVIALYRFARYHEATETGIVFPEIVGSDMLQKIESIPTRFVLNVPWSIPPNDLKTLYLGPLTQGTKVLVPALPRVGFFITIWDIIRIFSTIGGATAFVIMVWAWISSLI